MPRTALDNALEGCHAALMPRHAGQVPLRRPAPVAVHDDRHMLGDIVDLWHQKGGTLLRQLLFCLHQTVMISDSF